MMTRGIDLGVKVLGAIVLWIVGRWVIGLITRLLRAVLTRNSRVDPTLAHYLGSILGALLNLLLILAILQVFGVQTTSFAALLAGLGLAIVRSVMELHGGTARVESDAAGTRFILTFVRTPTA